MISPLDFPPGKTRNAARTVWNCRRYMYGKPITIIIMAFILPMFAKDLSPHEGRQYTIGLCLVGVVVFVMMRFCFLPSAERYLREQGIDPDDIG